MTAEARSASMDTSADRPGPAPGTGTLAPKARSSPRLLGLGSIAVAAILVDLGRIHLQGHSDSYVPILASLQRWTPFFWDKERYGLLLPLLALPIRDPLSNLLFQRALLIASGLLAVPFLARYALPRSRWMLTGLLAVATLLALAPHPWAFEYLADQPYGVSALLGLAGLAVVDVPPGPASGWQPWRWGVSAVRLAAGACLMVAAHWVNVAAGLVLLPLAGARVLADQVELPDGRPSRIGFLRDASLIGLGLVAGQLLFRIYTAFSGVHRSLHFAILSPADWPAAWRSTLGANVHAAGLAWPAVALFLAVGVLLLPWGRAAAAREEDDGTGARRSRFVALAQAAFIAGAGIAYAVPMALFRWVADNAFGHRYFAPSVLLVHLAVCSIASAWIARRARLARIAAPVLLALVPLAASASYGAPSLSRVRADVDANAGAHTEDVLALRCELLAGDYWNVWPTVLHADIVARERGGGGRLYGLTERSRATSSLWLGRPPGSLRVCRLRSAAPDAERWLRTYRLWPVTVESVQGDVELVNPSPAPPR